MSGVVHVNTFAAGARMSVRGSVTAACIAAVVPLSDIYEPAKAQIAQPVSFGEHTEWYRSPHALKMISCLLREDTEIHKSIEYINIDLQMPMRVIAQITSLRSYPIPKSKHLQLQI